MLPRLSSMRRPRLSYAWNTRRRLVAASLLIPFIVFPFGLARVLLSLGIPEGGFAEGLVGEISRDVALLSLVTFCWLMIRVVGFLWFLSGVAALAAAGWISATLTWRDGEYRTVIDGYKRTTVIEKGQDPRGPGGRGWTRDIMLPKGPMVRMTASDHLDVARVHYSDESAARQVFRYSSRRYC
jgi:hypothetical protein